MFLRRTQRKKDGKTHTYWNIVESKRPGDGRVLQRQGLYLGEINSSQAEAWRKAIEVFDEDAGRPRTLALFAAEPIEAVPADDRVVRVHLSELRLYRPRQWGACWLAGHLWRELELDRFWKERLAPSRKGTRWEQILQVLVSYRLMAPGSEWKLHRDWFGKSAMADILGGDFGLAEVHKLYACHDRLLEHKDAPGQKPRHGSERNYLWRPTLPSRCLSAMCPMPTNSSESSWTLHNSVSCRPQALIQKKSWVAINSRA